MKVVVSFSDFWNCRWKFTTGPTVVIMTWDPIAKSWTRNEEARASQTSLVELHVYSLLFWAENPNNHGKATEDATALWQAKKRRLPRWPAMHTTLRSSHTFHVIIFCHLTLDCEIGRASIADSGCDCFKTKSSLPIPVMHLGFQSRWISFHQPAAHNPLEVDYRFTSGHCTSPSCYSFSFPYVVALGRTLCTTDMFVWIRNPCWSSNPYLWIFFVISYQAWVDWGVWVWPCSLLFFYLFFGSVIRHIPELICCILLLSNLTSRLYTRQELHCKTSWYLDETHPGCGCHTRFVTQMHKFRRGRRTHFTMPFCFAGYTLYQWYGTSGSNERITFIAGWGNFPSSCTIARTEPLNETREDLLDNFWPAVNTSWDNFLLLYRESFASNLPFPLRSMWKMLPITCEASKFVHISRRLICHRISKAQPSLCPIVLAPLFPR